MESNKSLGHNSLIDLDTVFHIARLIRLDIDASQAVEFSRQFSQIIQYFQVLDELDTDNVPPANETSQIGNIFREDEVRDSLPRDQFLKNVPEHQGDYIKIPQVFDEN